MRTSALRRLGAKLHPLIDFVLPSDCFVCRRPLGPRQHLGSCPGCWLRFEPLPSPACDGCGLPRPVATDLLGPTAGRCAGCRASPPALDSVVAAVLYDDHARRYLLRAKVGRRPELLRPLAGQLTAVVHRAGLDTRCDRVVPVPSHPWMRLRRGFAPASEMMRPLARCLGLAVGRRLLHRRLWTAPVAKRLGAGGRRELAAAAFVCRRPVPAARFLLLDDVMTTGATVSACARALRAAGAAEVHAAVWARAPAEFKS